MGSGRSRTPQHAARAVARLPWWLLPALIAATLAAYAPAWHGGLLWDDPGHVTPVALRPLSGLWRIWFDIGATQQYYPVVHSAFWFLHRIWGDDTLGYHLVNIVLHALSAWLVAVALRRLAVPGAVLAAFVFALHPVQVESVAWITELKNVLSGVCCLGAALVYLRFDVHRRPRSYLAALALFGLAVLSKTVTATLPAALLVVFWWQRGRLAWRRDVLPLLPFFALGAAGGLTTVWVERAYIGAQGVEFQIAPLERVLIAGRAIWFYLATLAWPANLVFIYPRWTVSAAVWWQWLFPIAAIGLAGAAWRWRTRSRAPLAALLFFIATLLPALGFVNVYPFRYSFVADHFQYLASIGVIAIVSAGLTRLAGRWRLASPPVRGTAAVAVVGLLGFLTWQQSAQYVDAETLYRATIARNPSCWLALNNLAVLKLHQSRADTEEAAALLRDALRLKPDYLEAHYNLGLALEDLDQLEAAAAEFRRVLAGDPKVMDPHRHLGDVLRRLGRPEDAVVEYQAALRAHTAAADVHNNLGSALLQIGRPDAALPELEEAVRLDADYADAHFNLATALTALGRPDAALAQYAEVVRLQPDDASAHRHLGRLLLEMRRFADAASHFQAALRAQPDDAESRAGLAQAMAGMGRRGGLQPARGA